MSAATVLNRVAIAALDRLPHLAAMSASYSLLHDSQRPAAGPRLSRQRLGLLALLVCGSVALIVHQRNLLYSVYHRRASCTAESWSAGRWVRRPIDIEGEIETTDQALKVIGLEQCASDVDRDWMFALLPNGRLPRKAAMSWRWDAACDEKPFRRKAVIETLAKNGGLLLIGDSTTERSCAGTAATDERRPLLRIQLLLVA